MRPVDVGPKAEGSTMEPTFLQEARRVARVIQTRLHLQIPSVLARGETLTLHEAMAIGTAGYTAMLCVMAV